MSPRFMLVYSPPIYQEEVYNKHKRRSHFSYYLGIPKLSRFQNKIISKRFYVIFLIRDKGRVF